MSPTVRPPRVRAALVALVALALGASAAHAVRPSARLGADPGSAGMRFEEVAFPAAGDSATLHGWWVPGPARAPVLVLNGGSTGNRSDLVPVARAFHTRGFAVLLFDYRDFGPGGAGDADSLRYVVFHSRWADDAIGALRFARAHADSGARVFGWGRELGGPVLLAAAAREPRAADALVIDNPFRSTADQMRWDGTSVIPDAERTQRLALRPQDEPFSTAARLRTPLLLTLAGREESAPPAVADAMFLRTKVRVERWLAPEATRATLFDAPGYLDRVCGWLQQVARWSTAP